MLAGKLGFFGGAFTPRSIANLGAWWDCSDATRYTLVSSVVSSFTDSTGTYTIAQSTAANRPSISSINGRGAFSFNGSSTCLTNTTSFTPWGTYFFAARSAVSDNNGHAVFGGGASSPAITTVFLGMPINTPAIGASTRNGGTQTVVSASSATVVNSTYVVSAVLPSTTSLSLRINGASASGGAGNALSPNTAGMSLGCRVTNSTPGSFWSGLIGEVIWYNRTLSASEISQVESYLAVRWGIVL